MIPDISEWLKMLLAFVVALVIAYLMTPPVKDFAVRVALKVFTGEAKKVSLITYIISTIFIIKFFLIVAA